MAIIFCENSHCGLNYCNAYIPRLFFLHFCHLFYNVLSLILAWILRNSALEVGVSKHSKVCWHQFWSNFYPVDYDACVSNLQPPPSPPVKLISSLRISVTANSDNTEETLAVWPNIVTCLARLQSNVGTSGSHCQQVISSRLRSSRFAANDVSLPAVPVPVHALSERLLWWRARQALHSAANAWLAFW